MYTSTKIYIICANSKLLTTFALMKIKPPKFIRRLMPDLIWEIEDENGVFLTFDDGPTPGVTEWILSTLRRYNAKATFFVLGKNVEMYPDLYQKILA